MGTDVRQHRSGVVAAAGRALVGAENPVISWDLHVLVYETAESVSSQWPDGRSEGGGAPAAWEADLAERRAPCGGEHAGGVPPDPAGATRRRAPCAGCGRERCVTWWWGHPEAPPSRRRLWGWLRGGLGESRCTAPSSPT